MYDPERKQYIIKNSLGVSYHVYFEEGRGLCIRMLSDSRIWSRGYVLDRSTVNDFSVALDKDDIFHFFFQTRDGSLMYGHGMHGQIESQPVLNSKEPVPCTKHVSLLVLDNTAVFFYVLKHQNRNLLSVQSIHEGKLSMPVAIDYIEDWSYVSFPDGEGKCHLIYVNSDRTGYHINFRTLKDDFSTFTPAEKIFSSDLKISSLSAICTETNKIHILFEISEKEIYEIMYKNLSSDKRPETLYKSKTAPGFSGLVYNNGTLFFFRALNDDIYYRSSENDGLTWSGEALYPFGQNLVCFSYISNLKDENISARELPGNFSRGYRLAFITEETIKKYIQERKPAEITDNDLMNSLEKKIRQLQNYMDNMQKELTKLWIAGKNHEKKLEHLSRLYSELYEQIQYLSFDNIKKAPEEKNSTGAYDITQTGVIQENDLSGET